MAGKSSSGGARAVRLLLKAIRALPEREQQTVLAYLLERSLDPPEGQAGRFGASFVTLDFVKELGGTAGRMLRSGERVTAIAGLYGLPEDAVRAALREVASNPEAPQPLASILGLLAEGRSHAGAARELGIPADEVRRALEGLASSPLEGRLGQALYAYADARARASHAFAATAPRLAPGAQRFATSGLAPGFLGERPQPGAPAGDPEVLASRVGRLLLAHSDVGQIATLYDVPEAAVGAALHEVADHPDTAEPLASLLRLLADGRSRADAAEELGISEEEATSALEALLPSALHRSLAHALGAWMVRSACAAPSTFTSAPGVAPGPLEARRGQQMVPVRFPEPQYRRLKDWCGRHGFSMAVVVRGLVERFLDDQERRAA